LSLSSSLTTLNTSNDNHSVYLNYSNFNFHKVYLRQTAPPSSPWCYALTVNPTLVTDVPKYNFLASQVWPSARVAASICEKYLQNHTHWKVCELGCGPALPSLALASIGVRNVVATDIDDLALFMASKAAKEQGIEVVCFRESDNENDSDENGQSSKVPLFQIKNVDLTGDVNVLNEINADLYILSDVFETNHVAIGAAKMTKQALESGARVWVFAQSDRAQREVYRLELSKLLLGDNYNDIDSCAFGDIQWKFVNERDFDSDEDKLLLCDLDEVLVDYG
jgi:predicted nicotinamide N-methyase